MPTIPPTPPSTARPTDANGGRGRSGDPTSSIVDAIERAALAPDAGNGDHRRDQDGRAARRIAAVIGRMITADALAVGTRLPTVRDLSRRLGVSPTTVSARRGAASPPSGRSRRVAATARSCASRSVPAARGATARSREGPGHFELDLSSGTPDPAPAPRPRVRSWPGSAGSRSRRATSTTRCCRRSTRSCDASWPFRAGGDHRGRRRARRPRPRRPGGVAPR